MDPDKLRALCDVLIEKEVAEFEHETETERIRIVLGRVAVAAPVHAPGRVPAHAPSAPHVAVEDKEHIDVTSPFVGTFYRAPSPDAPVFVDIGAHVKPGQTLCIIEAMKLMNEIEAELSGTVVEIYVQNGKSVEYGQKLFRLKKSG